MMKNLKKMFLDFLKPIWELIKIYVIMAFVGFSLNPMDWWLLNSGIGRGATVLLVVALTYYTVSKYKIFYSKYIKNKNGRR